MSKKNNSRQLHKNPQFLLKPVYAAVLLTVAIQTAQANPIGGTVTSGQASFTTSGNTLTVTNTPGTIINWQGFSIGSSEITNFVQQSASSTVLNRVIGSDPSSILGTLQSNGRVFLINPNGIMFGAGSIVDVAGLVASSLNLSDADFIAGNNRFTEVPGAGNVSNAGNITAQNGGHIYLIAPNVENTGVITAPNGEILLAAGASVDLVNTNDPNLRVSITAPAGDATNVGQLIASSGSLGLFGTVVRNSGTVSADSATMQGGKIVFKASQLVEAGGTISAQGNGGGTIDLLADMQSGTVRVTGTLDASAPVSGDGGYIDTSAAHVQVADTARVTTAAANGLTGTWLIDPTDYTVSAIDPLNGSSWMSNTILSSSLAGSNIIIQTLATGGGNGDIFVNDVVTWSANTLTLSAHNNINIKANLNGSGTAGLALEYGQAALAAGNTSGYKIAPGAQVNLASSGSFSTKLGSDGGVINYTIIDSLGAQGSTTGTDLQGINGNLAGKYVLGSNIDATSTATWNAGAGFVPVGNFSTNFTGRFDGLGHTIGNLTINSFNGDAGLFGVVGIAGLIANVGLINSSVVAGGSTVGGLAGSNAGTIINSYVSNGNVSVTGTASPGVGGLVGDNSGSIINSYVSGGSVTGNYSRVGGLAGSNTGSIINSYVSGGSVVNAATWSASAGGLVGLNSGNISNSFVSGGSVSGIDNLGGLVGYNASSGTINNSYVSGAGVSGKSSIGGLVGDNRGAISNSYVSNGNVTGTLSNVGGLAGINFGTISNSYTSGGSVIGNYWYVGGLAGNNTGSGVISNTYVIDGSVAGSSYGVGGLVGINSGNINSSYASNGSITGSTTLGGVAGINDSTGSITNTFWDTTTAGAVVLFGISDDFASSGLGTNTGAVALTTTQTMNAAAVTAAGFDLGTTWWMSDNNTRPFLQSEWSSNITNSHQLQLVAMNLGAGYTLGANIDMAETASATGMWGSAGFVQLGDGMWNGSGYNYYTGQFDGLGHTISNLYINRPTESFIGLFGYLSNGNVRNVGLLNANVTGFNYVGGLVGLNYGNIHNGYASGSSVTGTFSVGGLVGYNTGYTISSAVYGGSISNSYVSNGSVTGSSSVGGLAGSNIGPVNNSYYNIDSVTINGFNHVTRHGLYSSQYTDWFSGGLLTPLNIANYNTSLVSAGGNNYTIGDVQGMRDLLGFADNASYNFSLTANIDLGSNAGLYIPFLAANFDGANFTISNLNINQPFNRNLGLFGNIAPDSTVNNVILSNAFVSGQSSVGALAGFNQGTISGSAVIGANVSGASGAGWVGGLVGYNEGTIDGSYASGSSVTGGTQVGGLAGYNLAMTSVSSSVVTSVGGIINNSYVSNGTVSGITHVGGLVGMSDHGIISNSYVSGGSVTGSGSNTGGLVGFNNGKIDFDSVDGGIIVSGVAVVGGLVGYNDGGEGGGVISNSNFSNGTVTGSSEVGGLVGYTNYSSVYFDLVGGTLSSSYVSNATVSATSNNANAGGLVGLNAGKISGSYVSGSSVTGTGSECSNIGGLVGYNFGGSISNSYVSGGTVSGGANIGGLVGYNFGGIIEQSYVMAGNITGVFLVGGLVGLNQGGQGGYGSSVSTGLPGIDSTISNSYVSGGTVSGVSDVGGLVGQNIVGLQGSGSNGGPGGGAIISNSYASNGSLSGGSVGGVVGYNSFGVVNNSFWDTTVGGGVSSGIGFDDIVSGASNAGTVGLVTAQMMTMSNFSGAGWFIANTGASGAIWRIYDGNTMPMLISFLTALSIDASNVVKTYDGQIYGGGTGVTFSTPNPVLLGTWGGTSQGARNVGSYTLDASGLYSDQLGYDISYINGTLTINPLALTGASIASVSTVYGVTAPAGTVSFSNVIAGDDVSSAATINSLPTDYSNGKLKIGSYTQTASIALTGLDAGNYTFSGYTTPIANYTVVIPTVIDEIVYVSNQNDNVNTRKPKVEPIVKIPTGDNGGDAPALPVCS